jgi:tetratricopeptide (TPR) repeat protein
MDAALLLVPALDKLGRTADADALYGRAAGAYAALAKDYPQSGHAHNAAAWLAACCHRDLDAALAHARTATELEPKQAGYRDTLAEVHFQRGETAAAVKLMRECIAQDPRKAYFGKQLKRFEAGDRTVPPPDEGDDE